MKYTSSFDKIERNEFSDALYCGIYIKINGDEDNHE
jgi:hypothetical protein